MSVPSMVHRSGNSLIVRSVVSGNALYESAAADVPPEDDEYDDDDDEAGDGGDDDQPTITTHHRRQEASKELPDCKVKRNYSCSTCDFFTQNPRHYLYHLRDDHNEKVKIYECPNCLYASKHFQKLLRHTKMVHGISDGIEVVDNGSANKRARKRPIAPVVEEEDSSLDDSGPPQGVPHSSGTQDRPVIYKCSVCTFTSRNQVQLTRHEREEHIKTKFFRCTKCTYVTHIKARFTKHVKYHSMPMIKCDMCDFRTPYKWNLDRHCKNHNGNGAFRCSACNFTADIKQSLTVHEMNHHVPPVGQAAGLGVGRRRNKVGASDATDAEEAGQTTPSANHPSANNESITDDEPQVKKARVRPAAAQLAKKQSTAAAQKGHFGGSDFIHPDDIIHHSNGKVYIKSKCKLCNFKSAWDGEMAKHERKVHNIIREETKAPAVVKKSPRPIPNLIPIPSQGVLKAKKAPEPPASPIMSQKDINDICAKSSNSVLLDFASLFNSEDVIKNNIQPKVPDLLPYTSTPTKQTATDTFKQKNASFFDNLRERLGSTINNVNLSCENCGHESKCLTEQVKHQKECAAGVGHDEDKEEMKRPRFNISSSRCQYCRQRCKSSVDLFNHIKVCPILVNKPNNNVNNNNNNKSEEFDSVSEPELKIDESFEEEFNNKPHPMENKVFVWNDIQVPMNIEVDDSNYEYTEDKFDENISLDLSTPRTHSPGGSESSLIGQEYTMSSSVHRQSPASTDKVPTHGNDITVAQHKRVFKCPHCTFWASTASRFHVHIVGHLNKKPFECSLCSYRSNWRWDITKHIKLKSVRDQAHENAKVLMTDETGRRNYTKYNKYLTEIPISSDQSMETSGGSGTRPKDRTHSPSTSRMDLPKLTRAPNTSDFSPLLRTATRPPPPLRAADAKKRPMADNKRTHFKCKKCNFRDPSREILLEHVKGHYQPNYSQMTTPGTSATQLMQDIRGTSPDKDERHCRLKHNGDIRVVSNKNGQEKIEMEEQMDEPDHQDVSQDGTYKCVHCPFSSDDHIEYDQHLTGHTPTPDANYKCVYCKYYARTREDIVQHFLLHGVTDPDDYIKMNQEQPHRSAEGGIGDKKFRCLLCPYITNSKSQFTYHKQFHKPSRGGQYNCTECTYNVSKKHLLHQHYKVHGINLSPNKLPAAQQSQQNGVEMLDDEEIIEEVQGQQLNTENFPDIPLVWVSKGGRFYKMYKCRYCPHVNQRKVNIQEHEKMHSARDKSAVKPSESEHRCTECNYVCNNAGVLSSHSKVHQGMSGIVHRLVDPTRTDDEQIQELQEAHNDDMIELDEIETPNNDQDMLYFCSKCPARFLKENEFEIHKSLHGSRLFYKCDYCSYTARQKPHLQAHFKVHTNEYQKRTKELQATYITHQSYQPPALYPKANATETVWMAMESDEEDEMYMKPVRSSQNVPLSGTDLFLQKNEANAAYAAAIKVEEVNEKPPDPQFGTQMHGNPNFIYPTYLKNGRLKEKRYKCPKCPSAFEKREQYKVHLGLHGAKQRYNCDYCDYSVKYYANYVQHLKKHKQNDDAQQQQQLQCDINEEEAMDEGMEQPDNGPLKLSTADLQTLSILQQRKQQKVVSPGSTSPPHKKDEDDKKLYWCTNCPYTSHRKDAVENHQKRHSSISGTKGHYTCEHCDYSVPQQHFLRDHTKLHFQSNKFNQMDGYMHCDNIKLTSNKVEDEENNVIIEEQATSKEEKQFLPPLNNDVVERFNNNDGEKQFVNIQTGELIEKNTSSNSSENEQQSTFKEDCNDDSNMEVN